MRIVAVLNGRIDVDICDYVTNDTFVICADGGGNYLYQKNIVPNLLIGDMDSIDKDALNHFKNNNCEIVLFNPEKDQTDGQLVIDKAMEYNPCEIVVFGGLGGRIDHTLGNIQLLYRMTQKGIKGVFVSENEIVYMTDKMLEIKGNIGDTVSVIPYEKDTVITLNGFKYLVSDFEFRLDTPIGISNELESEKGIVDVKQGTAIVVHNLKIQ